MTTFEIILITIMAIWTLCSMLFVFAFITFATNNNEKMDTLTEGVVTMLDQIAVSVKKDDKLKEE